MNGIMYAHIYTGCAPVIIHEEDTGVVLCPVAHSAPYSHDIDSD